MKKILKNFALVVILGLSLLAAGCSWVGYGYFDLTGWSSSNSAFNNCIAGLDTPEEICDYMEDNFDHTSHPEAYSPYEQWLNEDGDCNDYSTFAIYAAHTHGYEVYQIHVEYTTSAGKKVAHALGVFVEKGKLNYSDNDRYGPAQKNSFQEIVADYIEYKQTLTLRSWYAMNYDLEKVNEYNMTRSTEMHLPMPDPDEFGTLMGAEAKNRNSSIYIYTLVNKTGAALYSGTVKKVRIWANTTLNNCEIAIFYVVSGNNLSTRSNQTIGTVTAGAVREFDVNLAVQEGDYIGMYYTAGEMDVNISGGDGLWYLSATDGIPCTNRAFSYANGYVISLEGVVISPQ